MFDRYKLKQDLTDNIVTVVFEKIDGSLREMRCTLKSEYLPPQLLLEDKPQRAQSDSTLSVWDIDNGGWRSFRIDSIKNITIG